MRESKDDIQVIGNFNSESTYKPMDSDELKSILATTGRGYYIVAVLGAGQEPTNHALRDIAALGKDLMNGAEESCCCSPMRSSTRSSVRRNSKMSKDRNTLLQH